MSYNNASQCFKDNTKRIDSSSDPLLHNLNDGLHNLSNALEEDIVKIQNSLLQIAARIEQLEQK